MRHTFLILLIFFSITSFAGSNDIDKTKQAKEWLSNQPLSFIENKGQFTDSEGKPADNVLFKASYGNCDIYITTEGLSYVFVKYEEKQQKSRDTNDFRRLPGEKAADSKTVSYYRMDMNLQGSNINKTQIIKELPGKQGVTNYFYPHCPDGIYGVQEYGKITIKNIYKGIDWVIYTNSENKEAPLKYDFVVQPQANYKDIRIKFVNAQSTSLADNGTKLKIHTIAGTIEEGNLYSYQQNSTEKKAIKTNYISNSDSTFEFELGAYDKTKTVVIDPLVWATYYGGINSDVLTAVCADSKDNIYITGYSASTDFPIIPHSGAYWQPSNTGIWDTFVIKFNDHGVRQWATYYGGNREEFGHSICVDNKDNIFIAGETYSLDFPIRESTGTFCQTTKAGEVNAFVIKFNDQGVRRWATYYGGSYYDKAFSICTDSKDNIYITGVTNSPNFPIQQLAGAYNQSFDGWVDEIFIVKFNNLCERIWATFYGGNQYDEAFAIKADNKDNIYITGETQSSNFPTQLLTGAYYQSSGQGTFIVKFNNQGAREWATCYGYYYSWGKAICFDSQNNILIVGNAGAGSFPLQHLTGAYNQTSILGSLDAYILKFNPDGVRQWATFYGGSDIDFGNAICVDTLDNIYVTGETYSTDFPTQLSKGEYWKANISADRDAYILKFNNQGERHWATYYGGNNWDAGKGIAIDNKNHAYVVGETYNGGIYTIDYGNGAYFDDTWNWDGENYGSSDGFILKIVPCDNQKPTSIQTDKNNLCINETGNIILTAIGGIGDTLKWYSDKEGLNYLGKNTPFTIPVPSQTTTYYARWESLCDTSECDSVNINIYSQITKTISPAICEGESFIIGASAYTLEGTYTDVLTTLSGCDSIVTTNLIINPAKQTTQTNSICDGAVFTVGINNYTTAGTYTDHLKTYLGCDSTVTTHLLINLTKRTSLTPFICQEESYIVGTKVYTTTGMYSDTLTSFLFCDSIVTINLTVNPAYQTTPSPFICPGETLTVGTHTYSATGTYIDKLTTIDGCDSIITTNLTVYPVVQNIQSLNKCTGESITVGVNTYTETGTYTDVLTSSHNCDSTVITHLTINPTVLNPITQSICEGEIFTVGANKYSTAGNYIDVFKTSLGCDSTVTTILTVNPLPDVSLGDDQLLCPGDSILLSPGTGFSSYLWSDGSVLNHLKVNKTGTYSVTAFNEWCSFSDEITIKDCGAELWFPNAFTPNNDYNNDTFKPVLLGTLNTFHILVFNRWGQQIYESNQANPGWDGIFQGSLCTAGQYVYIATYSMGTEPSAQKQRVQRGSVTLLR